MFTADDVLDRIDELDDLAVGLSDTRATLPKQQSG
jgi:hypothetical protein